MLLWLAAHAAILAVLLGLKFLGAKAVALAVLMGAAVWLVFGRKRPLVFPAPTGMAAKHGMTPQT